MSAYEFAEGTHPRPLPGYVDHVPGTRLPNFAFDESRSNFDLGNGGMWIALRIHPATKRGYSTRSITAGVMVFPDGQFWLDAATVGVVERAAASQGIPVSRYTDLALREIAKVVRAVVSRAAPSKLHRFTVPELRALAERRSPPPDPWPPQTAQEVAALARLDRRPATRVDLELDGSLWIAVDDDTHLVIQPDADTDGAQQRWYWYVAGPGGVPEQRDGEGELQSLRDLLFQVDRWVGAFEGPYALTKKVGTRVRALTNGMTGRIIRYVPPVGGKGRRSYGIRWDNGTTGSGWFDRDLSDFVPRVDGSRPTPLPPSAKKLAGILELDRRVGLAHHVDHAGSLIIELDEGPRLVFARDTDDDASGWSYSIEGGDAESQHDRKLIDREHLLRVADQWLGALEGDYALTKRLGTRVRSPWTGRRGEIIGFEHSKKHRNQRGYVVEWDDGWRGWGLFDGDVE